MSVTAIADSPLPTLSERIEARRIIESVALHEGLEALRTQGHEAATAVLARYAPAYEMLVDPALLVDDEPPSSDPEDDIAPESESWGLVQISPETMARYKESIAKGVVEVPLDPTPDLKTPVRISKPRAPQDRKPKARQRPEG